MKPSLLFFTLLLSALMSFSATATNALSFVNAQIVEAPPGASVMAGYMEIQNSSRENIDIISIRSDAFKSIEIHLSKDSDGFAKMLPQKKLTIPANGKVILKPGSYHLMLIKPVKWFKHGDKITLDLTLSNKQSTSLEIAVKKNKFSTMKCASGKCGGSMGGGK